MAQPQPMASFVYYAVIGWKAHFEIAYKFAGRGCWWNFEPTSFDENQKKIFNFAFIENEI